MWGSDGLQLTQFTPTPMTLTERNQRIYELQKRLNEARTKVAWIETQIMATNQQYKDEQNADRDLFQEMFGEPRTLWEYLDKILDPWGRQRPQNLV